MTNPYESPSSSGNNELEHSLLGKWLAHFAIGYLIFSSLIGHVVIFITGQGELFWSQAWRTLLCWLFAFAVYRGINLARIFVAVFTLLISGLMLCSVMMAGIHFSVESVAMYLLMIFGIASGFALLHPSTKKYLTRSQSNRRVKKHEQV